MLFIAWRGGEERGDFEGRRRSHDFQRKRSGRSAAAKRVDRRNYRKLTVNEGGEGGVSLEY